MANQTLYGYLELNRAPETYQSIQFRLHLGAGVKVEDLGMENRGIASDPALAYSCPTGWSLSILGTPTSLVIYERELHVSITRARDKDFEMVHFKEGSRYMMARKSTDFPSHLKHFLLS